MNLLKTPALTAALVVALCAPAFAADNAQNLYDLSTQGSSQTLKAGEQGKFVVEITPKNGAHVSDEAPLKLELSGDHVTPAKTKLTRADLPSKTPRFEVPITAQSAGQGKVDAKLTFFICTAQICSRQQKTLSIPVEVR